MSHPSIHCKPEEEKLRDYISSLSKDFNRLREENSKLLALIKNVFEWDHTELINKDECKEDSAEFIKMLDVLFNYYKDVTNGNKK